MLPLEHLRNPLEHDGQTRVPPRHHWYPTSWFSVTMKAGGLGAPPSRGTLGKTSGKHTHILVGVPFFSLFLTGWSLHPRKDTGEVHSSNRLHL